MSNKEKTILLLKQAIEFVEKQDKMTDIHIEITASCVGNPDMTISTEFHFM